MSPIASHSQESKEQPSPPPAPGARAELIPGAGFRQSPVAPGAFQRVPGGPSPRDAWGSFVQEPAHWQLRVCSQVPAKAEIFIYGFFLKDKKNGKKSAEAAPRKRHRAIYRIPSAADHARHRYKPNHKAPVIELQP